MVCCEVVGGEAEGLSLCRACNEQVYDERADLELTEYTTIDRAKYKDLLNRCSGFSAQLLNHAHLPWHSRRGWRCMQFTQALQGCR